jgi:hypothetical protein
VRGASYNLREVAHAMNGEVTAQLVVSSQEAYVAYSVRRRRLGPNGEPRIARLLHTSNGGQTWSEIPWRRTLWSRISHLGFPTWPPEGISQIEYIGERLTITHRDEWVPFEPGGESLWCSTRIGSAWKNRRVRAMRYEDLDSPASIPQINLDLPRSIRPPAFGDESS